MEIRRVGIQKLAPTGEGVARGAERVGFVEGALPGEEVDAEVLETRSRFWRGRASTIHVASRDRRPVPEEGCGACDWAHFDVAAARAAKRELFLETMQRIGKMPADLFGAVPVEVSPLEYRLRNRLHVAGTGEAARIGAFAVRTHRVTPLSWCAALTPQARAALEEVEAALRATPLSVSEVATLEDRDGSRRVARVTVADENPAPAPLRALARRLSAGFSAVRFERRDGRRLLGEAAPRLTLGVGGRTFSAAPDVFFQTNRFLVEELYARVRDEARSVPGGDALDAYGGVGLLAGALLDAGHRVVSVEGDARASREAGRARASWEDGERWRFVSSSVDAFVEGAPMFPVVVADPPRAGLGTLAAPLARRAGEMFLYVSCEPATLARDLPPILAEGFAIRSAHLFDMFPLTHRVEAMVSLERV